MSRDEEFGAYVAVRLRAQLYRNAWLLCGDPHRAEDLVQETLTKLYVAWPRVSRADAIEAYVRRMLINGHIDDSRRPRRRERLTAEPPDAPGTTAAEEADELWTALRALPAGQRRHHQPRHLILLCRRHHTLTHHTSWTVAIDPDTRHPVWQPPPKIDDRDRYTWHPARHLEPALGPPAA